MAFLKNPKLKHPKLWFAIVLAPLLIWAFTQFPIADTLPTLLNQIKALGIWSPLAFIALYIIATVLLIPGSLLTLGGGLLFGLVWGSIYVFLGATLGSIAAFLTGRYLARNWVTQKINTNPKFTAIYQAIAQEGFKIVFLTRLSPLFPFTFLNYILGVTTISLKDYTLASLGMIPGTILYVYLGSLAGNLAQLGMSQPNSSETQILQWVVKIVGFIATIVVTGYITNLAKKSLNETIVVNPESHELS